MFNMYVAEMHEKNSEWDDSQFDTTRIGIFSTKAKAAKACKAEMDGDVSDQHWFWFSITEEILDSPEAAKTDPAQSVKIMDHEGNKIPKHPMEGPVLAPA